MNTELYGLIGKKLVHSFSPRYFNDKFKIEGIRARYELFPLESIEALPELLRKFPDLRGINVTIPYKQEVLPFLDEISQEAESIGAVNVIKIIRDDKRIRLKGFNTDVLGFKKSLSKFLNEIPEKALILGTGGASKAVEYVLKNLGINFMKVSRNEGMGVITYNNLSQGLVESSQLIVNTTPAGTFPQTDQYPPFPYDFITSNHFCHDLIYNPETTSFMKKCREKGAKVKNGLEMLHGQAEAAWEIWQGKCRF